MKADFDQLLLDHEQLHFDITELFTRILKKQLSQAKITRNNFSNIVSPIVHRTVVQKDELQELYDKETEKGRNRILQAKWNKKTSELLEQNSIQR